MHSNPNPKIYIGAGWVKIYYKLRSFLGKSKEKDETESEGPGCPNTPINEWIK